VRDQTGAKVIGTLSKGIEFPKLETDISRYRRQHIVGSLFYSNFKVNNFSMTFIVFTKKMFSNEGCLCTEYAAEQSFENAAGLRR
jgi:adenine-specific DNA methylase